jgi:hypothetical protein
VLPCDDDDESPTVEDDAFPLRIPSTSSNDESNRSQPQDK